MNPKTLLNPPSVLNLINSHLQIPAETQPAELEHGDARCDLAVPAELQPRTVYVAQVAQGIDLSLVPGLDEMRIQEELHPSWFMRFEAAGGDYAGVDSLVELHRSAPSEFIRGMTSTLLRQRWCSGQASSGIVADQPN